MSRVKEELFTGTELEKEYDEIPSPDSESSIGLRVSVDPHIDPNAQERCEVPENDADFAKGSLIYQKMALILQDAPSIGKDKVNQAQKFKFRGIDDAYNALNRVFAKHGVFCTSKILSRDRQERTSQRGGILAFTTLTIEFTFWATDGSNVKTQAVGEGMDSGDKSSNKAMSVAHKYALLQSFLIPTEDMPDPDSESHELGNKQTPGRRSETKDTEGFRKSIAAAQTVDQLKTIWKAMPKEQHVFLMGDKDRRKFQLEAGEDL